MEELSRAAEVELRKGGVATPGAVVRVLPSPALKPPTAVAAPPASALPQEVLKQPNPRDAASARLTDLMQQYGVSQPLPVSVLKGSLYVAVSFSMPEETVRKLIYQATWAGAGVILKGFDGTPARTRDRIMRIVGEARATPAVPAGQPVNAMTFPKGLENISVRVAPKLFDRFDIREVPAFVLVSPKGSHDDCRNADCEAYKDFVTVQGDVSVAHALETIGRLRPGFRSSADYYTKRGRRPVAANS